MKIYGGLVGGVGPPEIIPEQVVAVHLGFEAGDVTVTKVLAEFIDFLQLQQVDSQDLDCLHHLRGGRRGEPRCLYHIPLLLRPPSPRGQEPMPSPRYMLSHQRGLNFHDQLPIAGCLEPTVVTAALGQWWYSESGTGLKGRRPGP